MAAELGADLVQHGLPAFGADARHQLLPGEAAGAAAHDHREPFFDAVGAGEVEVVEMPGLSQSEDRKPSEAPPPGGTGDIVELKQAEVATGFKGYEDGPRQKLAMDADDRPKISLWVNLTTILLSIHH